VGKRDGSLIGGGQGLTAVTGQTLVGVRVLEPTSYISKSAKSGWPQIHVLRRAVTQAGTIVTSVEIAQLLRFGSDSAAFHSKVVTYHYTTVSAGLIRTWFGALVLFRCRVPRVACAARSSAASFSKADRREVLAALRRDWAHGHRP
jgi:hypothetical protein